MQTTKSAEKKEKSITELIIVIIVLGLLMKLFISYYFSQEQNITKTAFKTLAQNFKNTVVVVHAQWQMDNKPATVTLSELQNNNVTKISVNNKGWIDTKTINNLNITACEHIWLLAMSTPMSLMKLPIVSIEIHDQNLSNYHQCRYILSTGEYFEYRSATGQVTQVYENEH